MLPRRDSTTDRPLFRPRRCDFPERTLRAIPSKRNGSDTARCGAPSGWRRWTPLVVGIATFVELTPGMFGGFVIARLAIGFWLLLFAALGQSLRVEAASRAER